MTFSMARGLVTQMFHHLQDAYPNEGGGFLLGTINYSTGDIAISAIQPVKNTAATEEQYHRYLMTPEDWARLEDEADQRGLTLVGYYHSHPDSPAVPSEYDRIHALPNFRYLITSVRNGQTAELRAWQLSEDRAQFQELQLEITGE
ncbi:MAG: M67 family metallopeptidase [Anaerolineae bacterium]